MILDALLNFVPIGGNLSLVGGAGVSIPSSNVIDLLGQGQGTAPQNIIGNRTLFGEDSGLGAVKPQVAVFIGTGLVAVGGSTLNIAMQAAPDSGTPTYLPGTWQTLIETGPLTAAQLAAQAMVRFDWPAAFPANLNPRYLRLLFQMSAGGSFSVGVVSAAVVTMVRDDQANKFMANNYALAR